MYCATLQVEPTAKGLIKLAQPFLTTSQSMRFGVHFHDYGQYSTYTCIKMSGSESLGQEEAVCVHLKAYMTTTVRCLHGWQV